MTVDTRIQGKIKGTGPQIIPLGSHPSNSQNKQWLSHRTFIRSGQSMAVSLFKDSVYQKLGAQLRGLVIKGKYAPGDKFLTEREISDQFEVSRPTANKALASLVSEGLLEFRKGIGTFVRGEALDFDLSRLVSFEQKAKAAGRKPATRVLVFQKLWARDVPKTVQLALECELNTESGTPLIYMERLRLADRLPVILEKRYVRADFCPGMSRTDVRGSLYQVFTEKFGLIIDGAREIIRAVNVTQQQAALLEVEPHSAGLLVIATGYLFAEQPLWYEETLYRSDAYEFRNRLGGLSTTHPAVGTLT